MPRYKYNSEEGLAHIFLLIVVVGLVGFAGSANIITTKEFSEPAYQSVLGENEESKEVEEKAEESAKQAQEQQKESQKSQEETQNKQEEQHKEAEKSQQEALKKVEEQKKENVGFTRSGTSNSTKTKTETVSPTGTKSKIQTEGQKSETEIETADGQKIKTKVEDDGTTKIEIEHGQLKVKYVFENGRIRLKAENELGQEVELNDDELEEIENEIEDELKEGGVEIATGSGRPLLTRNNVAALTNFPLSLDVGTNRLIVTTPAGQRVVTVLPDEAVQNLLATKIINKIDKPLTPELENLEGVIDLEIRNDEVVYRVKGAKTHNLLGFIPVDTSTTVFVSAQTGQPVAQEQSVLTNFIDLLSP